MRHKEKKISKTKRYFILKLLYSEIDLAESSLIRYAPIVRELF